MPVGHPEFGLSTAGVSSTKSPLPEQPIGYLKTVYTREINQDEMIQQRTVI